MILITGANGWLGLNLVEALTNGEAERWGLKPDALRCLILPGTDQGALRQFGGDLDLREGDLRNPADVERFVAGAEDAILFHTAGIIHPQRVRELYEINRDATERLLRSAAKAGVRKAVVVSSNSPCGCNPHPDHLFDEDSPYRPYMNYGRSKMAMEQCVKAIQSENLLETVLIRAPWFYGPNQPPRQKLFFEMIRTGKVPLVGSGTNLRSMAFLENLAQGLVRAASVPEAVGQVFWVADERPYSMREIIDTVEHLLEDEFGQDCAHRRVRLPGLLSDVAEWVDASLQGLGLYHQKIHVLSEMNKTIACSVERAREVLGYRPEIALEEGMRRSLQEIYNTGGL